MENETIVQFVGFTTKLAPEDFINTWEIYARKLAGSENQITLLQSLPSLYSHQTKFKYISKHCYRSAEFNFMFMKSSGHTLFPENSARVVQVGGYIPLQLGSKNNKGSAELKIIAFLGKCDITIDYFHNLPYTYLNIYQAYFENCVYEFVLEFFLEEPDATSLIKQLQFVPAIEIALIKELPVPELFEKA